MDDFDKWLEYISPTLDAKSQWLIENAEDVTKEHLKEEYQKLKEEVEYRAKILVEQAERVGAKQSLDKFKPTENFTPQDSFKFVKNMINNINDYKELLKSVLHFQSSANRFLGHEMKIVYTSTNSNREITLYEIDIDPENLDKVLSFDSYDLNARFRSLTSTKILNSLEEKDSYQKEGHLQALNDTYSEVYYRYQRSKAILTMQSSFIILWKQNKRWHKLFVNSAGVLGEAYANYFFHRKTMLTDKEVEEQVRIYAKEMEEVTNAPGFLQEDVAINAFLSYGIKGEGASIMGISDIIKYAQDMLKNTGQIYTNLINLKKRLYENDAKYTQLAQEVTKQNKHLIKEKYQKEYEKLQKDIGKYINNKYQL